MLNKQNKIILASFVIFAVSLFLHAFFSVSSPLYMSGFFLALYIPGFAIKNIFDSKGDVMGNLLAAPVFTIFFFVPLYFGITKALDGQINFPIAITFLMVIALFSILKIQNHTDPNKVSTNDEKYIFIGIGAFILVHILSTLAYALIPEVDGYADLIKIEGVLSSGIFNISYRPLFSFFVSYIALISHIPPYYLFKFGMILIQITSIYYLFQLTKKAGVKTSFSKYLILISSIAIPVINLEVDYIRPQVIFIFAILPFIYFLSQGIESQKRNFLFSTIIATIGLFFHEFFGILFLINAFFISHYFYKKFSSTQKAIFFCISPIVVLFLLVHIRSFPVLLLLSGSAQQFIQLINDGLQWKWWFLGTYSNMDGNNLGWTGAMDILKYYAYSLSPFLTLMALAYPIVLWKKIKNNETTSSAEKIALSVLFVGLLFAELLPRINYPTLPDRFWPMISLSLLAISPFVFSKIKFVEKQSGQLIVLILLLIGISGSLYITKAKGGYTSNREYQAALWIKQNTPKESVFITQGGNGVMIRYFAERTAINAIPSFFLGRENGNQPQQPPKSTAGKFFDDAHLYFKKSLADSTDENLFRLNTAIKEYVVQRESEEVIVKTEHLQEDIDEKKHAYILYSKDKFNTYYANRKWWRDTNFYGADLSIFNKKYELVYNDHDTVYIWKIK